MEEVLKSAKNKELIVRKRVASFLEKLLRYYHNDYLRHDIYKGIVYSEIEPITIEEEKYKNYYDSIMYLLSNKTRPLSKEVLSRFFYLLYRTNIKENTLSVLASKFFFLSDEDIIDKIINYHLIAYENLDELDEMDRTIVSLTFINYLLVKNNIPCIHFLNSDLNKYFILRNEYLKNKDKEKLYLFFMELLKKNKYQDKKYYKNLKELELKDICNEINKDIENLQKEYKIKHLYIFGSFVKGTQRLDSDIDLIAQFSLELTFNEKMEFINELKNRYFNVFNRYVDLHDISKYVNDEFIKETPKIKKIY